MKNTEHNPTLRVLNILETLASNPEGLTLTQIAEVINSPKSTILPIIHTMANKKFIFFNEKTYTYTIGINSFCVGSSYTSNTNALQFIKSEMEYVVKKTDEICQMGILEGGDVLYVAKVDSTNPIRILSSVGKKLPAYCTALGKAMLFNFSKEELNNFYPNGLKAYTKNTITYFEDFYKKSVLIGDGTGHGQVGSKYFSSETCEFQDHFLHYHPDYAIINNIELDHVDYFGNLERYIQSFEQFAKQVKKTVIVWGDDPNIKKIHFEKHVLRFGLGENNDVRAVNVLETPQGL